jgi:hypothetical protein
VNERRAALVLHGLVEEDRDWVLARLSATERGKLRALLDELAELGLPKDASTLAAPAEPFVAEIDAAPPARVHAVLRDEQDTTVATLLGLHAWQWRRSVLRLLGRRRRVAIEQLERARLPALARRVRDELVAMFAAALASPDGAEREHRAHGRDRW